MQSPQQKISAASARARSASMNLTNIANELDKIATTLPTTKDQSLFKATTISKPLRYVKSQSQPLPKLTKKEKQIELNSITVESLNISSKQVEKDPKRVQVTITLGQILQCLLWDYDFRFTLLPHQIEAVFAASGIKVSPLLDKMIKLDKKELSRLIVVDARKQDGMMARRKFCKENVDFTKNRGMILADVMGLGKTVEVRFFQLFSYQSLKSPCLNKIWIIFIFICFYSIESCCNCPPQ
jgi:SNF2 family DNA or RNA helicase